MGSFGSVTCANGFSLALFAAVLAIIGIGCIPSWAPSPPVTPGYCGELCSFD